MLWPLVILLPFMFAKGAKLPVKKLLIVVFAGIILVSLALSILSTDARPGLAFYLPSARAWEFAAGGCLAVLPTGFLARMRIFSTLLAGSGIALLIGGFFLISARDPFPGILAAVPVLGTLLVIAGGSITYLGQPTLLLKIEGWRPVQWVGERSYSWYLWHCPAIVLPAAAIQSAWVWLKMVGALAPSASQL